MVSWPVTGVDLQSLHVDSFPGWFQVLIYNQSPTDSFPGLLQVLNWDLKRLVEEISVLAGFRY